MVRMMHDTQDVQDRAAAAHCARCGGELYTAEAAEPDGAGRVLCGKCRSALEDPGYDGETVTLVMEAMDEVLKGYLADVLRAQVWNAVAKKFPE